MTTTVSGSQITFNDNTTQNTSAYGGGFAFRNCIAHAWASSKVLNKP